MSPSTDHVWLPYTDMAAFAADPLVIVGGEGCEVVDADGNRYVDAISGLWNVQVGYGREEVVEAAVGQLRRLAYHPLNGRCPPPAAALADRLVELAPPGLNHVFYGTGGAEAVETAVKMARQFWRNLGRPERVKVVGLHRGWHGCTLGALSAGGVDEEREPFGPLLAEFPKIPPPYCYRCPSAADPDHCPVETGAALRDLVEAEGPGTVAAFIAEPVMGLAGMVPPTARFWQEVQRVCRELDLLLIVDEVAVGFGRTGRMFASEHYGIRPDILACAKGITSAYLPLSATLATDRVYDAFLGEGRSFVHGYTFGGNAAACAAALANLDVIERDGLCARAAELGAELLDALRSGLAGSPVVGDVRGIGLAIAVELVADRASRTPLPVAAELCRSLADRGVLVRPVGAGNVLPLIPPLTIERDVAMRVVGEYCDVIRALEPGATAA